MSELQQALLDFRARALCRLAARCGYPADELDVRKAVVVQSDPEIFRSIERRRTWWRIDLLGRIHRWEGLYGLLRRR